MRYVLDASVAVAALRRNESHHSAALRRCMPLFEGSDEIVVPAIFELEVTSALVRRGVEVARIDAFFERHFAARDVVTIGVRAARQVRAVIAATGLRAADALYVWVAARERVPLVTLDDEVILRGRSAGATIVMP